MERYAADEISKEYNIPADKIDVELDGYYADEYKRYIVVRIDNHDDLENSYGKDIPSKKGILIDDIENYTTAMDRFSKYRN